MMNDPGLRTGARVRPLRRQRGRMSVMTGTSHPYFAQVLDAMIDIQAARAGKAYFAFTAPRSGAGVTYVVRTLARELARETGEKVLITDSLSPAGMTSRCMVWAPGGVEESSPDVWTAMPGSGGGSTTRHDVLDAVVDVDDHGFGYVLVDAPPLNFSSQAILWAERVDALFLVVAAGETTAAELNRARAMVREGTSRLAGVILNKRTYPVPRAIFSLFRRKR